MNIKCSPFLLYTLYILTEKLTTYRSFLVPWRGEGYSLLEELSAVCPKNPQTIEIDYF